MVKQMPGVVTNTQEIFVNSFRYIIHISDIEKVLNLICSFLTQRINNLILATEGSGLIIDSIKSFKMSYHKASTTSRLGFFTEFPVPRGKRLVFNPKSTGSHDNNCLLKCLAAFAMKIAHENINKQNNTNYKIRWDNITRKLIKPINIKKYLKFEKLDQNQFTDIKKLEILNNFCVNVYKIVKESNSPKHDILLVQRGNRNMKHKCSLILYDYLKLGVPVTHCFLVKESFQRFIRNFCNLKQLYDGERQCKICSYCFSIFENSEELLKHKNSYCINKHKNLRIKYPSKGEFLKFKNFSKCNKIRYVAFFDFECLLIPVNDNENHSKHVPIVFTVIIIDTDHKQIIASKKYLGLDCVDVFVQFLVDKWKEISPVETNIKYPIHMTDSDKEKHYRQKICSNCKKPFNSANKVFKHAHHCHSKPDNNYITALCGTCNMQNRQQSKLTCLAHSASYDISLILTSCTLDYKMEILTQKSPNKFYYLDINKTLRLQDSLQFLKAPLQKLVFQYAETNKFFYLQKGLLDDYHIHENSDLYNLLSKQKGNFPFSVCTDIDKLFEEEFPEKKDFFNDLKNIEISDIDYKNAQNIYTYSRCSNLGEYLTLYCFTDTLFLADIYLNYREIMFEDYSQDTCQSLTLPSFSLDCFLFEKYKEDPYFGLELIPDPSLSDIVQKNVRGGFVSVLKHVSNFENVLTWLDNISSMAKEKLGNLVSDVIYLDVNSLYPYVMQEKLPYRNFIKLPDGEMKYIYSKIKTFDFINSKHGYWFLVTLAANSDEVQKKTDMFPFALQKVKIKHGQLSEYMKNRTHSENITYERLVGHHFKKVEQLYDARTLQFYINRGIVVETLHAVYQFDQENFLKDYINKNINKRKMTSCPIKANVYKLFSNSIFGKFLTNELNYTNNSYICTTKSMFIKRLCSENFVNLKIINQNKVIINSRKKIIKKTFPNYIGFAILEKSRRYNYEVFYDVLLPIFNKNSCQLLYCDTDSFIIKYFLKLDEVTEKDFLLKK